MKISIAMATYNGAKYLQEQLDSFVKQIRQPDELVITDDGSTDETFSIIQSFAETVPFEVRVHRNRENLGLVQNFGRAIEHCYGDIIFLSDQDDVWANEKLKTVEEVFIEDPNVTSVINDEEICNEYLQSTGFTKLAQKRSARIPDKYFIDGCCSAFRASLRRVILPIPAPVRTHDEWIHLVARQFGKKRIITRPLQWHRRHKNNVSQGIAYNAKQISLWDRVRVQSFQCPIDIYERRINLLAELERRLSENGEEVRKALGSNQYPRDVVQEIRLEKFAWEHRKKIIHSQGIWQFINAVRFWFAGGYNYFDGWKSFGKDFARPFYSKRLF